MCRPKASIHTFLRTLAAFAAITIGNSFASTRAASVDTKPQNVAVPASGLLAEVPFTTSHNWIILDVKIGQNFVAADRAPTLHFLLDTGASASVLTKETLQANRLDLGAVLSNQANAQAEGAGDSSGISTNQSVRTAVEIGDLHFVNALAVFPLGESLRRLGIDGLIGDDVLRSFVTEVDYAARVVRFYDPARYRPPVAGTKFESLPLQFRESDDLPFVDAAITPFGFSPTSARMTLDTGDDGCVTLYTPYVERQRWQDALPRTVPANFSGVGGGGAAVAGRLRSVSLGATNLNLPPVVFAMSKRGALATEQTDGQFGGALLNRFTIILDFGHRMLYVKPNDLAATRYPQLHYFGYFAAPPVTVDGGYRIGIVEAGSPAEQAGIHVGDILYKVDERPVADLGVQEIIAILQKSSAKSILEVGSGAGTPRRQVTIAGISY